MGFWFTFGLFGWLRLELTTGVLSADPNMLLEAPPGGTGLCGRDGASGSPNIPLLFPPAQSNSKPWSHFAAVIKSG